MLKLRLPRRSLIALVLLAALLYFGWTELTRTRGDQRVSFNPAERTCDVAGPLRYCVHRARAGTNGDVVYHLHGRNLDEQIWNDDTYFTSMLQARWQSVRAVFPSAEEAAIEIAIHDLYSEKGTLDPDALDALTAEVGGRYSPRYAEIPARKGVWMLSEGYYMAPMQEFNEAYAAFLAVRYWQAWRADPVAFRKGYLALLREGYDAPPADLLRRKLGIDMGANDFVPTTLAALESEVERLRH